MQVFTEEACQCEEKEQEEEEEQRMVSFSLLSITEAFNLLPPSSSPTSACIPHDPLSLPEVNRHTPVFHNST